MHAVVMESLEDYLSGSLERAEERALEAHLAVCKACREDLRDMQSVSQWFGAFRPPTADSGSISVAGTVAEDALAPSPGFYACVIQEVETRKKAPSFSAFFALDFNFGRRLVLSSLLTLVVVGGFRFHGRLAMPVAPVPTAFWPNRTRPASTARPRPPACWQH